MNRLHTYHFPFLSGELKIEAVNSIPQDIAKGISDLIIVLKNDLNDKYLNSSSYKLNNSSIELPVIVSPEFIEFFEMNVEYFIATRSDFSPFKNPVIDKSNLGDYFIIDKSTDTITKIKDFKFDSPLQKFYLIQKIVDELSRNNIKNYYLKYVDVAASFGNVRWNASFEILEDEHTLDFKLHNSYAYFFAPISSERQASSKFANIDKEIDAEYIILIGANLTDLKILSLEIANLSWLHQYKQFKSENNIHIIIYTANKDIINL